jgi:hypothetical protein
VAVDGVVAVCWVNLILVIEFSYGGGLCLEFDMVLWVVTIGRMNLVLVISPVRGSFRVGLEFIIRRVIDIVGRF